MKSSKVPPDVTAIVPAAGIGKRFGTGTHKQFETLQGKPILIWALEIFQGIQNIREIIPVLASEDMEHGKQAVDAYRITKVRRIAPGGKERQDSVWNGLKLVQDKNSMVLIHDGVRPLIEKRLVESLIEQMMENLPTKGICDGIVLGMPPKDTIKEAPEQVVKKTLNRNILWAVQTPQIFPYKTIYNAYNKAMQERFYSTDDAALVERYKGKVHIVQGSYRNIKITTPEDLMIAEALLKTNSNI
jgi:2-C-methyl-D-erythritol 4-phosphate cytidylyltransferase